MANYYPNPNPYAQVEVSKMNKTHEALRKNKISFDEQYGLSRFAIQIFYAAFLYLPVAYNLIAYATLQIPFFVMFVSRNALLNINFYLFNIVIPLAVLVYFLFNARRVLFGQKLFGIFLFFPIRNLVINLLGQFLIPFGAGRYVIPILNILFSFGIIFFYFYRTHSLKIMMQKIVANRFALFGILVAIGFVTVLVLNVLFNNLQAIIDRSLPNNQESINNNLQGGDPVLVTTTIISTVVVAPIIEELTVRFTFQNVGNNKLYTYFLSTFFFAFLHIQNSFDWTHILSYFSLGIVAGFIFYYWRNIYIPIALHFIINIIAVVVSLT